MTARVSLRLSEIAPKPPSPRQSFKIMQRNANGDASSVSRASSTPGDEVNRRKTLEERAAEYALARQRIYGDATEEAVSEINGNASRRAADEENAASAAYAYNTNPQPYMPPEPVYASLVHPSKVDPVLSPPPPVVPQHYQPPPDALFAYQPSSYSTYQQNAGPSFPRSGYNGDRMPSQHGMHDGYSMLPQQYPGNGFQAQAPYGNGFGWTQPAPVNYGHPPNMPIAHAPMAMHGMGVNGTNTGWYGPMSQMPGQPMPMITQGVQYMGQYAPPPPPQVYPHLNQPTPMRPAPVPHHESAGSSISSRSYQDMSRPHSRGSTTSTRSATSSVRMGFMYPGAGLGYRQHGMKGSGFNTPGVMSNLSTERRQARAHSPVSLISNLLEF